MQHLKYSITAVLFILTIALLTQCGNGGEELIPTGATKCTPENCEFKVTERIKLENVK